MKERSLKDMHLHLGITPENLGYLATIPHIIDGDRWNAWGEKLDVTTDVVHVVIPIDGLHAGKEWTKQLREILVATDRFPDVIGVITSAKDWSVAILWIHEPHDVWLDADVPEGAVIEEWERNRAALDLIATFEADENSELDTAGREIRIDNVSRDSRGVIIQMQISYVDDVEIRKYITIGDGATLATSTPTV